MTRMAPLLRGRKRDNVSAPSPPTFYYRRGTLSLFIRPVTARIHAMCIAEVSSAESARVALGSSRSLLRGTRAGELWRCTAPVDYDSADRSVEGALVR